MEQKKLTAEQEKLRRNERLRAKRAAETAEQRKERLARRNARDRARRVERKREQEMKRQLNEETPPEKSAHELRRQHLELNA